MSHLRSEVANIDSPRGHVTTGIFGSTRPGFSFTDLRPPASIPPPADCRFLPRPAAAGGGRVRAHSRSGRDTSRGGPCSAIRSGRSTSLIGPRRRRGTASTDPRSSTTAPSTRLALVVLADTMPGAVAEKVGRQDRSWFAPSVDLTVHLLDRCRSPWVLAHNRSRFAGDGYASADMALWDCGQDGDRRPGWWRTPPRCSCSPSPAEAQAPPSRSHGQVRPLATRPRYTPSDDDAQQGDDVPVTGLANLAVKVADLDQAPAGTTRPPEPRCGTACAGTTENGPTSSSGR